MNRHPPAAARSPRFFVGLWDAMNFTRRLVLNLLFFGAAVRWCWLVIGAGGAQRQAAARPHHAGDRARRRAGRAVHAPIRPRRALAKALRRHDAGEVQLRDLLRALDAAREDKRIERVLLRLDGLAAQRLWPRCAKSPPRSRACAPPASRWSPSARSWTRASTCWPRRPTRSTSIRWAACCWKAWAATASTTARACRTSSASTCTCSRSANTSPPPSPTCSTPHRRNPRKPTCSG